jgi:hypothetical protein
VAGWVKTDDNVSGHGWLPGDGCLKRGVAEKMQHPLLKCPRGEGFGYVLKKSAVNYFFISNAPNALFYWPAIRVYGEPGEDEPVWGFPDSFADIKASRMNSIFSYLPANTLAVI